MKCETKDIEKACVTDHQDCEPTPFPRSLVFFFLKRMVRSSSNIQGSDEKEKRLNQNEINATCTVIRSCDGGRAAASWSLGICGVAAKRAKR